MFLSINYYKLFYWLTVADGVKSFFDSSSNIFTTFTVIAFAVFCISIGIYQDMKSKGETEEDDDVKSVLTWVKNSRKVFTWFLVLSMVTWVGYVFTPSKKDAVIIIAGGAVGNFITNDTSARQLPTEVMTMLRAKVREVTTESLAGAKDTLESLTKEELIEQLRNKKED